MANHPAGLATGSSAGILSVSVIADYCRSSALLNLRDVALGIRENPAKLCKRDSQPRAY